jgi:hypothetical protein
MTMTDQDQTVDESTAEPERLTPEVVTQRPPAEAQASTELERRNAALDNATDAALAMPGVPGRDEFLSLAMQARILSMSGAAPKAVRDNPYVAFHLAMIGRDLGISPSAAIALIDVIGEGDKIQASLSPQLLNGQLRRLQLGHIVPAARSLASCTAVCLSWTGRLDPACAPTYPQHAEGCTCAGIIGDSTFTWEDAQIANLVDDRCPDAKNHWSSGSSYCKCRQGYRTYPGRMLWWRAAGFAADDYFPEAGLGLYSPEELGAVVDAEGRPIDPTSVELPEGYEPPPPKVNKAQLPSDPDELWLLQERIASLPAQERDDLRERWKSGKLKGAKPSMVKAGDIKLAASMVAGFEAIAKRGGEWDPDTALTETRTLEAACVMHLFSVPVEIDAVGPSGAAEPTQADDATETAPEPSGATGGDSGADGGEPSRERIEQVVAMVQKLTAGELTGALRARTLPATGNDDTRRRRLCEAILKGEVESLEQRGDAPA